MAQSSATSATSLDMNNKEMATAHASPPINIAGVFNTDELSDVTTKFHDREVKCHKIILCAASDYFKGLLGPNSKFMEADQKIIELKNDEDRDAVEAMLSYIYSFEYEAKFKTKAKNTRFHLCVLITADKYLIPRLSEKALIGFMTTKQSLNEDPDGAWELIKLHAKYPAQHDYVNQAVKTLKSLHLYHLLMKPELHTTLPGDDDLHQLIRGRFDTSASTSKFTSFTAVSCCDGLIYAANSYSRELVRCHYCRKELICAGRPCRGARIKDLWELKAWKGLPNGRP